MSKRLLIDYKRVSIMLDRAIRNKDTGAIETFRQALEELDQRFIKDNQRTLMLAKTQIALAIYLDDDTLWEARFKCRCCKATVYKTIGFLDGNGKWLYRDNPLYGLLNNRLEEGELLLDFPHEDDCPVLLAQEVINELP